MPDDPAPVNETDSKPAGTWSVLRRGEDGRDRLIQFGLSESEARQVVASYQSMGQMNVRCEPDTR
jgi:hypothetical protein